MPVTGLYSEPKKNPLSQWRNDSGELDVFEAARYFSGANETNFPGTILSQKSMRNERPRGPASARMSLDVPIAKNNNNNNNPLLLPNSVLLDHHQKQNKKPHKQPSSPGGRLASFLNSLFNQKTSKNKKPSKSGISNQHDPEQETSSPGGPRKRRSSISHFRISANDSSSSSANTPTKSYREFTSFHDHGRRVDKERDFRKFSDADDGADTDSSSDLFDLPNHNLDFYSSGLPVYGTTHVDRIMIVAPISRGAAI